MLFRSAPITARISETTTATATQPSTNVQSETSHHRSLTERQKAKKQAADVKQRRKKLKFELDGLDFSNLDSAFDALKTFVEHCKDVSDQYTLEDEDEDAGQRAEVESLGGGGG